MSGNKQGPRTTQDHNHPKSQNKKLSRARRLQKAEAAVDHAQKVAQELRQAAQDEAAKKAKTVWMTTYDVERVRSTILDMISLEASPEIVHLSCEISKDCSLVEDSEGKPVGINHAAAMVLHKTLSLRAGTLYYLNDLVSNKNSIDMENGLWNMHIDVSAVIIPETENTSTGTQIHLKVKKTKK
jgi:hypothetical protein